jgi:hypothetical protein
LTLIEQAITLIDQWYNDRATSQQRETLSDGHFFQALVLLELIKDDFAAPDSRLFTPVGRVRRVSKALVGTILGRFAIQAGIRNVGGRTTPAAGPAAKELLHSIRDLAELVPLPDQERRMILEAMQGFLAERFRERHAQQRLHPVYNPSQSTRAFVAGLLALARDRRSWGPVAQYLIGAKLQCRFPELKILNRSSSAADASSGRPADFFIGDTAFHVTVAPSLLLYQKCQRNLAEGYRVYLLVPDDLVARARRAVAANNDFDADRIAVESIESFVGQNIEESCTFARDRVGAGLRHLLEKYNERVAEIESDESLQVDVPGNLPQALTTD